MANIRKLIPLFDRVLIQRFIPETKTKSGIMLPEQSVGKLNEGKVVAVGGGMRGEDGNIIPISVKEGDKVLLPEYGGMKIEIEGEEYHIFREGEILGKFD